jgi:hypothetical protein
MEDKPLSPKWFIQAMAFLAVAGMTIRFASENLRSESTVSTTFSQESEMLKKY